MEFVYTLSRLEKNIQGRALFKNISLSFFPGAKIGVIGPNGSGKSTLLKIMAGLDQDISGEAYPAAGIQVGYLPQEPRFSEDQSVWDVLCEGCGEMMEKLKRFEELNIRLGEVEGEEELEKLSNQIANLQDELDASNAWDLEQKMTRIHENLKCPAFDRTMGTLSGGEARRVALSRLILSEPDLFLLDEPTNHLDALSTYWLQNYLKKSAATVVVVTHDRYFLDEITEWILELEKGKGRPWEASYHKWLEEKIKEKSLAGGSPELEFYEQELHWLRLSDDKKSDYHRWRLKEDRKTLGQKQVISLPPLGQSLGQKVCEIKNLSKSFGGKTLFENFSMVVPRGAIVGVVGPNGAGKSTLFNLLSGLESPDEGSIDWGETVELGFADQVRGDLDESRSVFENLAGGQDVIEVQRTQVKVRSFLSQFGFRGGDQQKQVAVLSGGEKNRLYLAQTLLSGANVLILDEPTNDLDLETLRSLELALETFQGTLFLSSHDRWFLDRLCTHSILLDGKGNISWFDGSISQYLKRSL